MRKKDATSPKEARFAVLRPTERKQRSVAKGGVKHSPLDAAGLLSDLRKPHPVRPLEDCLGRTIHPELALLARRSASLERKSPGWPRRVWETDSRDRVTRIDGGVCARLHQ